MAAPSPSHPTPPPPKPEAPEITEEMVLPPDEACMHASGIYRLTKGRPRAADALRAMLKGGNSYVSGSLRITLVSPKARAQVEEMLATAKPIRLPKSTPVAQPLTKTAPVPFRVREEISPLEEPFPPVPVTQQTLEKPVEKPQALQGGQDEEYALGEQETVMSDWASDNVAVIMFTVKLSTDALTKLAKAIDDRHATSKTPPAKCGAFEFAECVSKLVGMARRTIAQQAYAVMNALRTIGAENSEAAVKFEGVDDLLSSADIAISFPGSAEGSEPAAGSFLDKLQTRAEQPGYKMLTTGGAFAIFACNICAPIHGGACIYRSLILVLQDVDKQGFTTLLPMPTATSPQDPGRMDVRVDYSQTAAKSTAMQAQEVILGTPAHKWDAASLCAHCLLQEAARKYTNSDGAAKKPRHTRAVSTRGTRVRVTGMQY